MVLLYLFVCLNFPNTTRQPVNKPGLRVLEVSAVRENTTLSFCSVSEGEVKRGIHTGILGLASSGLETGKEL